MKLIVLLDASAAYANTDVSPSYQVAIANLVHGLGNSGPITTTSTTKTVSTTTKTATSTTVTAVPTGTPSTCIKDGEKCSTEGQVGCSGNSFAMCNHGVWGLQGCPNGLTCFSTTDGGSVYCGQGNGGNTCDLISPLEVTRTALNPIGPTVKPYKGGHVTAQFSVTTSDTNSFTALVNVRRLDQTSFGKMITAQFKVADNIQVTNVKGGHVYQKGNQVKIQLKNEKETMMAVIQLKGQIKGGIFVAPKVNTMKFY